jgi:hypothetical protein
MSKFCRFLLCQSCILDDIIKYIMYKMIRSNKDILLYLEEASFIKDMGNFFEKETNQCAVVLYILYCF